MNLGPRVTLLMPNRDNAPLLDLVLGRLAENTTYHDFELLVVDDGSTDDSVGVLRRWRDSGRLRQLRLIERDQSGVVDTLNAGLAAATGELVVQLDGDASVETPGWLEQMVEFFLSDERIGAVTAKVVLDTGEIHACGVDVVGPEGLHDGGTEITEPVGRRTYHQRVLRRREGDCEACLGATEVDGGMGCCMMYRCHVAREIGGYDRGFAPVWFDDLDLTLSLRRHGLKVFCLPDVRVIHHLRRTSTAADVPARRRVAASVRAVASGLLPQRARLRVLRALQLDRPPREHRARLAHHYAYWREKWGFDMLNPDMAAVLERWGGTEVCWRYDDEMREAGERIVAAHQAVQPAAQRRP